MIVSSVSSSHIPSLNFKAGMTKAIKSEILMTDCNKVQKILQKEKGINANFAGNKVIAWSVYNVTKLLSGLRGLCKPKTFLPLNIMTRNVDDFYEDDDSFICGFTNYLPYQNVENPKESLPAMSIIFNKDFDWENLDGLSDIFSFRGVTTTDHFLEPFFHEFSHIMHGGNLMLKHSADKLPKVFDDMFDEGNKAKYRQKYQAHVRLNLCSYALESPLEMIASDMSKRLISNLSEDSMHFKKNPFRLSPYDPFNFLSTPKKEYDIFVKDVFNGNLNSLYD